MRSHFLDHLHVVDATTEQRRAPPERYSLGFSVLVILAVTLLGWAAIGYATLMLIQQIKAFNF